MAMDTVAPSRPVTRSNTKIVTKDDFLGINKQDRVQVFIDATNLLGMLRVLNRKIDYKLFMKFLKDQTRLVRASYYVVMRDGMAESAERVIDMLEYNGFDVYRKWIKEFQDEGGHYRLRGSIIPEMTVAMIDAADHDIDHIVLVSGDGELLAALEAVKFRGCRTTLIGRDDAISQDLRRACDAFIDISSLEAANFFYGP